MKIKTGYLYHIKDEYFIIVNDDSLMQDLEKVKKGQQFYYQRQRYIMVHTNKF